MTTTVYKHINLVGSSADSIEDAIQGAIGKANKSVKNIGWFEVTEIRGHVDDGKVDHYQVGLKVGFRLE